MGAITFCDVVVSHQAFSDGLLFHQLVHVEQYRQLGIPRFSELYVRGFLNGGSYEAIQLEVNAYTLGGRFESNPRRRRTASCTAAALAGIQEREISQPWHCQYPACPRGRSD